ncbi:unnamed protein product [Chironomus riparius]|uniref:Transmembrane protein n=1 Tax=Chironomus riparius TaxID=315576 RepID=A0A9N9S6C7_9DIPT|nr:unnamed protein product [Chironomus riparius]
MTYLSESHRSSQLKLNIMEVKLDMNCSQKISLQSIFLFFSLALISLNVIFQFQQQFHFRSF